MLVNYKIAPLNVNGMTSTTRLRMLADFILKEETDAILLKEVSRIDFDPIREYKACTNVGMNKRGTAMPTTESLRLTYITNLPSGWGMSAQYRCVWYIGQETSVTWSTLTQGSSLPLFWACSGTSDMTPRWGKN